MSSSRKEAAAHRRLQFEQFEQRLVMSAQAVAAPIVDLLPEMELAAPAMTGQEVVWQQSDTGPEGGGQNATTIAADIAAQYGLDGAGQTVAVIDSGIAWDHYAFGGSFGEGNHVVGGWDFAENDDNPYDDGPAGYHGSHVAGIIGSLDEQYQGVASGADLVSLRVFDDQGGGNLGWVEEALQWVHEHQNNFEYPITTVNLSLGTGWDPESTPGWGSLDDEFAKLKADGIFISVAAGNYYKQINDVGLSYPAASEHVVPVSSHGEAGQLSDFAQRDDGILVAPGEMLRSPVPDHLFGGNSSGRFLASSGTSMAAPYVAGASAVLRQANWFMGETSVNQQLIYDQLIETADRVYDAASNRFYDHIDLSAALEAVISDKHEASLEDATHVGNLASGDSFEGLIGRLDDVDAFKFTATETGRLTMVIDSTHDLAAEIETRGERLAVDGNEVSFDVVAGQVYGFKISTTAGTGHYSIGAEYESSSSPAAVDLGVVSSNSFIGLSVNNETTFQLTPVRDGILTLETSANSTSPVTMEVYDSQQNLLQRQTMPGETSDGIRLDVDVIAGEDYFFKLISQTDTKLDVQATNLVSLDQGHLVVHGTGGSDQVTFEHGAGGSTGQVLTNVNGVGYTFSADQLSRVNVIGHGGDDSLSVKLSQLNDKVATRTDSLYFSNERFVFHAWQVNDLVVAGGGGFDTVTMHDSTGSDELIAGLRTEWGGEYWTSITGDGFSTRATGFEAVSAKSSGHDVAKLFGTGADERFATWDGKSMLQMDGSTVVVDQFDSVEVNGGGGNDLANLFDSAGNDDFSLMPNAGTLRNGNYEVIATGFAKVNAFARNGNDAVSFVDSSGRDVFYSKSDAAVLKGEGYVLYANGFADVSLTSVGGEDVAQLHDSAANDRFKSSIGHVQLDRGETTIVLNGIENVGFVADGGGYDRVQIDGSAGDDRLDVSENDVRLQRSNGEIVRIANAEETSVDLMEGIDYAALVGGDGRDKLEFGFSQSAFETTMQLLQMTNYENVSFDGQDGRDSVSVDGPIDLLSSIGDQAKVVLENKKLMLDDFSFLEANNVDSAIADYDLDSVDFTYMLRGEWNKK